MTELCGCADVELLEGEDIFEPLNEEAYIIRKVYGTAFINDRIISRLIGAQKDQQENVGWAHDPLEHLLVVRLDPKDDTFVLFLKHIVQSKPNS